MKSWHWQKVKPLRARKPSGEMFALAPVNDFELEVELLKNNAEFMAFLKKLSQEKATISLRSLRE